jgi:hypothetical protein
MEQTDPSKKVDIVLYKTTNYADALTICENARKKGWVTKISEEGLCKQGNGL